MSINIKYNSNITFVVSSLLFVGISILCLREPHSISIPSFLFEFESAQFTLGKIARFFIGLPIALIALNLTHTFLYENKLYEGDKVTLLIPLLFLLCSFPYLLLQIEWLFISFLILYSIRILNSIYTKTGVLKEMWLLGLINAIIILIEPYLVLIAVPILIGLTLLRSFKIRESLYYLVSLFIFLFWVFSVLYLMNVQYEINIAINRLFKFSSNNYIVFINMLVLLLILILAYLSSSKMIIRKKDQTKVLYLFVAIVLLLSFAIGINASLTLFIFLFVSVFGLLFQSQTKKGIVAILFYALSSLMLGINFF